MKTTTLRIPDDLHKRIRHQALDEGTSMNAWILRALETKAEEGKTMKCYECGRKVNDYNTEITLTGGAIRQLQDGSGEIVGYYDTVSKDYLCRKCYENEMD